MNPNEPFAMDTIEDFRQLLRDHRFTCGDDTNREPLGTMLDVHPEERSDGLLYDNGKRYWASIQCRVCLYEWSFPKLLAYAARGQLDLQMFHGKKSDDHSRAETLLKKQKENWNSSSQWAFGINRESKPWKGICCKSCWYARKRPCKCRCRRVNHQRGVQKVIEDYNQDFEGVESAHTIFMQSRENTNDK